MTLRWRMGHLVRILTNLSIEACARELQVVDEYLSAQVRQALAPPIGDGRVGVALKRLQVAMPLASRPTALDPKGEVHNFVEVINQLATIERLIDCLAWAMVQLPAYRVVVCHPTTSSQAGENDLVLRDQGSVVRFEVCDVVGRTDGNRKEQATLDALGVERWLSLPSDAPDRLVIIASPTFGDLLLRKKAKSVITGDGVVGTFAYVHVGAIADTVIVELRRSSASRL